MSEFEKQIEAEMDSLNQFFEVMKKQRQEYLNGQTDPRFKFLPPVEERE